MDEHSEQSHVKRYLGVDPGLNRTGYAILERSPQGPVLIEGGVIRSTKGETLTHRVHEIAVGIREVFEEFRPQMMGVEQVYALVKNPKSAVLMAHARGVILSVAAEYEVPVLHFSPTQVKRILTGSGKASKEQMQHAVKNEFGLEEIPEPHDVADASAIALCLYHNVRFAA